MSKSDDLTLALERSFLASEFLTWLWFRCEVEGGVFDLPSGGVSLAVEDALSLASWDDDALKASLRGGAPTRRPEAANALASGLLLKKARFILARDTREWLFSLDGDTLDLSSVKVVDPDAEEDEDEDPLATKLAAGEELRGAIDALYGEFLAQRLDGAWDRVEVPRLREWVRFKLEHASKQVGVA